MIAARRPRNDRGASAVEFALVMPILVTLLFGTIWTGLAYADHIAVNNAVREGARYGAAADASLATWPTSVRDRVKQVYANAESSLTDSQICVRLINDSNTVVLSAMGASCGTIPSSWPPTMTSGSCAVEVWATKPRTIPLIVFPDMHVDVGGNSIAYYGRTVTACPAQP